MAASFPTASNLHHSWRYQTSKAFLWIRTFPTCSCKDISDIFIEIHTCHTKRQSTQRICRHNPGNNISTASLVALQQKSTEGGCASVDLYVTRFLRASSSFSKLYRKIHRETKSLPRWPAPRGRPGRGHSSKGISDKIASRRIPLAAIFSCTRRYVHLFYSLEA